jgi:hypothetical protein
VRVGNDDVLGVEDGTADRDGMKDGLPVILGAKLGAVETLGDMDDCS